MNNLKPTKRNFNERLPLSSSENREEPEEISIRPFNQGPMDKQYC